MQRLAVAAVCLLGFALVARASAAVGTSGARAAVETIVVNVWPAETPADIGIPGDEMSRIYQSAIVGPTKLVTNVTKPTLTIYPPPIESNTGTAVVICPGGGYWDLFWEIEGEEVAAWLNSIGVTGIILKYRVPRRPGETRTDPPVGPQLDAQRAMRIVRSRAAGWKIDPNRIGIIGFSAGGHLALATATGFAQRTYPRIDAIDDVSCRPDFAILCYSGFLKAREKDEVWPGLQISPNTPPVLLTHASDDKISSSEQSAIMYLALLRAGVPAELHIFNSGNHDFGVRQNGNLPASWTELAVKWLRSLNLLKAPE